MGNLKKRIFVVFIILLISLPLVYSAFMHPSQKIEIKGVTERNVTEVKLGEELPAEAMTLAGSADISYFYVNGILVAKKENDIDYFHLDNIGNVRFITDESGDVISKLKYSPFGRTVVKTNPEDKLTFISKEETNGLMHLGARFYDSNTGRFLSVDPILNVGETPYSYAANNPKKFVDPSGTYFITPTMFQAGFISAEKGRIDISSPSIEEGPFSIESSLSFSSPERKELSPLLKDLGEKTKNSGTLALRLMFSFSKKVTDGINFNIGAGSVIPLYGGETESSYTIPGRRGESTTRYSNTKYGGAGIFNAGLGFNYKGAKLNLGGSYQNSLFSSEQGEVKETELRGGGIDRRDLGSQSNNVRLGNFGGSARLSIYRDNIFANVQTDFSQNQKTGVSWVVGFRPPRMPFMVSFYGSN